MLIKVKIAPDNEILWDMGTCYIVTEHKSFIEVLYSIMNYKVMPFFLDDNKQYFSELVEATLEFDKEIDLSVQCIENIIDDTMPFRDKIAQKDKLVISKVV